MRLLRWARAASPSSPIAVGIGIALGLTFGIYDWHGWIAFGCMLVAYVCGRYDGWARA